ncbi:MAG: adenine nucleotide alpha hydrolase family protein [Thermoprotei archaeon]|nr:adenine nucleotide alpha hydrolase family protein [Thermoprotei archaeon]
MKISRALMEVRAFSHKEMFILAAVSGGRGSRAMLTALSELLGDRVVIMALTVDEGIPGVSDKRIEAAKRDCENLGIEHHVVSLKKVLGFTIGEVGELYLRGKLKLKPCTVCGVLRRYILNKMAKTMGADLLSTGHTLDDEAQEFLMKFIKGNIKDMTRSFSLGGAYELLVPRLRPLKYCSEEEIYAYLKIKGKSLQEAFPCPFVAGSYRDRVRQLLRRRIEEGNDVRNAIIKVAEGIARGLEAREIGRLKRCPECGEPTSRNLCRTCELKDIIKRVMNAHRKT